MRIVPAEYVDAHKLTRELNKVLQSQQMRSHFEPEGLDMLGTTSGEFVTFLQKEMQAWSKTIKESAIRLE